MITVTYRVYARTSIVSLADRESNRRAGKFPDLFVRTFRTLVHPALSGERTAVFSSDIRIVVGRRPSHPFRRTIMAKGQLRSNREQKKPKQPKKVAAAPSTSTITPSRMPGSAGSKKK